MNVERESDIQSWAEFDAYALALLDYFDRLEPPRRMPRGMQQRWASLIDDVECVDQDRSRDRSLADARRHLVRTAALMDDWGLALARGPPGPEGYESN